LAGHYILQLWLLFSFFLAPQQISTGFASWLCYCTDVAQWRSTKFSTIFDRLLGWYTLYISGGSCPVTEFCHVQNSLCVQVLRSTLAMLLHGTRAVGVSQTLHRSEEASPISAGRPPRWASAQILVLSSFFFFSSPILSGRRLDVYHTSTRVALVRI